MSNAMRNRRLHLLTLLKLSKFGPKGSWAVVTGASDGIGKESGFHSYSTVFDCTG